MEWVKRRPAPELQSLIAGYVGYRLAGFPAGLHRGLPSRFMTLIVGIGPAIDVVAQCDAAQAPARYRCVVGGLQDAPALIAHDGFQEGVAIHLSPVGSRALLGMPAGELWNVSLELDDLAGAIGGELWERLQGSAGWDRRFAIVDDVLGRLAGDDGLEPALGRAWQLVTASHGTQPIAEVADALGWSRQHFTRRFQGEFGLTPKRAARIVRFERAQRMLRATPSFVSIAQVAAACGYYDQAHMSRDFVALAGCPPGRLLADEDLPSFQDTTGAEPAPSAA